MRKLQVAKKIIQTHNPTIFLSVHPQHIIQLGSTVEELERLIENLDYKVTDLNGKPVRPTELTEYIVCPQ